MRNRSTIEFIKEEEQKILGWSAKRELAKLNYHIHTVAIKQNLIPKELSAIQASIVYANEADVLNIALLVSQQNSGAIQILI